MKQYTYQIIIIIILLVILITGWIRNQQYEIIRDDKRNFSISDTLKIDKITIQNRNLEKIQLTRNKTYWNLNDSLIANKYSVNLLLKTIKEMRVKTPIARSALDNVIKRMAVQNIKVIFYYKQKQIKTIYIGGETADQLGTFMMIEGAKEPYVVHIPGFNGYLSSRFSCKEELWLSKLIFHNINGEADYQINEPNNEFHNLVWHSTKKNYVEKINCEKFIKEPDVNEIKKRKPFMILRIKNQKNQYEELFCIRKKSVNKPKYINQEFDQERFYGIKNNRLMLIQYQQLKDLISYEKKLNTIIPWE